MDSRPESPSRNSHLGGEPAEKRMRQIDSEFVLGASAVVAGVNVAGLPTPAREEVGLRVGKWTREEESYTERLVQDFDAGLLDLANGDTLRPFLAERLNCCGMRISKKFHGDTRLGKQGFKRCAGWSPSLLQETEAARSVPTLVPTASLRAAFIKSIAKATKKVPTQAPFARKFLRDRDAARNALSAGMATSSFSPPAPFPSQYTTPAGAATAAAVSMALMASASSLSAAAAAAAATPMAPSSPLVAPPSSLPLTSNTDDPGMLFLSTPAAPPFSSSPGELGRCGVVGDGSILAARVLPPDGSSSSSSSSSSESSSSDSSSIGSSGLDAAAAAAAASQAAVVAAAAAVAGAVAGAADPATLPPSNSDPNDNTNPPHNDNPWLLSEGEDADRRRRIRESIDSRPSLRVGKWTKEEESFTDRLISDFDCGVLPLASGETLRPYLAEKLNCSGMRITKKFTADLRLGKQGFKRCAGWGPAALARPDAARVPTSLLEAAFSASVLQTAASNTPLTATAAPKRSQQHSQQHSLHYSVPPPPSAQLPPLSPATSSLSLQQQYLLHQSQSPLPPFPPPPPPNLAYNIIEATIINNGGRIIGQGSSSGGGGGGCGGADMVTTTILMPMAPGASGGNGGGSSTATFSLSPSPSPSTSTTTATAITSSSSAAAAASNTASSLRVDAFFPPGRALPQLFPAAPPPPQTTAEQQQQQQQMPTGSSSSGSSSGGGGGGVAEYSLGGVGQAGSAAGQPSYLTDLLNTSTVATEDVYI